MEKINWEKAKVLFKDGDINARLTMCPKEDTENHLNWFIEAIGSNNLESHIKGEVSFTYLTNSFKAPIKFSQYFNGLGKDLFEQLKAYYIASYACRIDVIESETAKLKS